jgi:serine phosphatase RsbU (regulator of sigma subunit)
MESLFLVVLLFISLCFGIYFFINNKNKASRIFELQQKNQFLNDDLVKSKQNLPTPEEIEKAELQRKKIEEKNKKLWAMSETVHKERKLIEEQNELLLLEKEKLEATKIKLDEKVKKLWSQSTAIHKEKERINELKDEIEHKHQEILDSVNYAKRIQKSLLASDQFLKENLPEHFVLFKPKDIVSGDFYWANKLTNNQFSLLVGDSTGHGVPGAIMSILNISCLNESVNFKKLLLPNEILDFTRSRIMDHMANDGSEEGGKDGMDALLCNFDFSNNLLQFAAANNPLWLIRSNELIEFKPDKMPIGKAMGEIKPFSLQEIQLKKGDLIIMLTDGFADQFGGPKGKKFMYRPLKELLVSINNAPLEDVKTELNQVLSNWKGDLEQVDDILIFGVRI